MRACLILLALMICACSPASEHANGEPVATTVPATTTVAATEVPPNPKMQWLATSNDLKIALSYMVDETDNVAISFVCTPRSGRVEIAEPDLAHPIDKIRLWSGQLAGVFSVQMTPADEEMGFGPDAIADNVSVSDPLLQSFAKSGSLRFTADGGPVPANDEERERIRAFFAQCAS
ncbi:MAG: hypothetical protein ABUL42_01415 [Terricaulis silvestris]